MQTWIALLRGINVGGHNKIAMADLAALIAKLNCDDVKTYIQSGNVVFRSAEKNSAKLEQRISSALETDLGITASVFVLSAKDLNKAVKANPFPEAESEPKTLHVFFMRKSVRVDAAKLDAVAKASEQWQIAGKVFYLHAPDGIARSVLAAKCEKLLGVDVTARNWRTVTKLAELAA